jgi:hypothetical protein
MKFKGGTTSEGKGRSTDEVWAAGWTCSSHRLMSCSFGYTSWHAHWTHTHGCVEEAVCTKHHMLKNLSPTSSPLPISALLPMHPSFLQSLQPLYLPCPLQPSHSSISETTPSTNAGFPDHQLSPGTVPSGFCSHSSPNTDSAKTKHISMLPHSTYHIFSFFLFWAVLEFDLRPSCLSHIPRPFVSGYFRDSISLFVQASWTVILPFMLPAVVTKADQGG